MGVGGGGASNWCYILQSVAKCRNVDDDLVRLRDGRAGVKATAANTAVARLGKWGNSEKQPVASSSGRDRAM